VIDLKRMTKWDEVAGCTVHCSIIKVPSYSYFKGAEADQPIQWYLGGRVADIQQVTNVWVGSPSPFKDKSNKN
jgi:hypothetical protein